MTEHSAIEAVTQKSVAELDQFNMLLNFEVNTNNHKNERLDSGLSIDEAIIAAGGFGKSIIN